VAVIDRCESEIVATCESVQEAGGTALPFVCDIRDGRQVEQLVQAVIKVWGTIHILVNNATIFPERVPLREMYMNPRMSLDRQGV
jgi:NAD(P)-dependent dehydrogenase (short-subunit alcohol dehydrogenase family)